MAKTSYQIVGISSFSDLERAWTPSTVISVVTNFCGEKKYKEAFRSVYSQRIDEKTSNWMSSSNLKLSNEKNIDPLPEPRTDNSARPFTDCLASTELNRLSEPKRLYGETVARREGWPYHRKKVTRLGQARTFRVWISNHGLNFRTFTNHVHPFGVISRSTWLANELIKSINDS